MLSRMGLLLTLSVLISISPINAQTFPKLKDYASSFETNVEITKEMQDTTAIAKEYYDFNDKTGRLDLIAVGSRRSYFIYGETKEIFTVTDTACKKADGGTAELDIDFYQWTIQDPLYVGPSAVLFNAEKLDPMPIYLRDSTPRGINCLQFRYAKIDDKGRNLTIDYHFSASDWTLPYKGISPIRIMIYMTSEIGVIRERIDFLYFRPNYNNKNKFQPPVGLGCWDRTPNAKIPEIPKQFSFSTEVFDLYHNSQHDETEIGLERIWFDSWLQVARQDRYSSKGEEANLVDFRTGVIYTVTNSRMCKVKPIRNVMFEKYEPDSLVGYMKKPEEILFLQGEFYEMGEEILRGIKCKVYEKAERDILFRNERYYLFVTTVFFAQARSIVDGEDVENPQPVELLLTGYKEEEKISLQLLEQIFAFNDVIGMDMYTTFPISSCFPDSNQKSFFMISIDAPEKLAAMVEEKHSEFIITASNTIVKTANVTEIRLPFIKIDYQASGIMITGRMLDKPASLAQFWLEDTAMTEEMSAFDLFPAAKTQESCATACVEKRPVKCTGFHFCNNVCFLNTGEITDKIIDPIKINTMCSIYIRAEFDSNNTQDSLSDAMKNLDRAIQSGKMMFTANTKEGEVGLKAVDFTTTYDSKGGGDQVSDYPYTLVKSGALYKSESDATTTIDVPDVDTEHDCYRSCKTADTISCSGFSYCQRTRNKMCRISTILVNDTNLATATDSNSACDVFNLLYLDFFVAYPGKVSTIAGEKQITDIYSPEDCAKNCKVETEFKCRGFEHCKGRKTCVLHSKHVLDFGNGTMQTTDSDCTHYAAKFSADYKDMGLKLIDDESNVRMEINLEECSRACSEEIPNCNSFNYCPPSSVGSSDSSCSFTSKTILSTKNLKTKDKCHLYTKREKIFDWVPRKSGDSYIGYSSGGFAWLIVGMIVLGLVVGSLLFVVYSYYRTKRGGDGMTVKFSKNDDI